MPADGMAALAATCQAGPGVLPNAYKKLYLSSCRLSREGGSTPTRAGDAADTTRADAGPGDAVVTAARLASADHAGATAAEPIGAVTPCWTEATMPTPKLLPADGDPPEDPAAAELAPARRGQFDDTGTPRTEHPTPDSVPTGGPDNAGA
jgi:hypothetical protein